MTTTETTEPDALAGIYARYREIAPDADPKSPDPSEALAVSLLVHAQRDYTRTLSPAATLDYAMIGAMCARFAAAHMLAWLRANQPEAAVRLSGEIASAWDDGGSIGEWLWEHAQPLGVDTDTVNRLAEAEAAIQGAKQRDAEQAAVEMATALALAQSAVESLGKLADSHERVLYAASVDLARGDADAARALLWEQLDGFDWEPAGENETGMQYLNRMRDGRKAEAAAETVAEPGAKPEPAGM